MKMTKRKSKDPFVSLFYSLLRDHIQPGVLEKEVIDIETAPFTTTVFTNGYLLDYAKDIVDRLRKL